MIKKQIIEITRERRKRKRVKGRNNMNYIGNEIRKRETLWLPIPSIGIQLRGFCSSGDEK